MFTVMKRLPVDARHAPTFEVEVLRALHTLRSVAGLRGAELLRPTRVGEPYIVRLDWDSAAQHDRWLDRVADPDGPFAAQGVLRRLLIGGGPPETFEALTAPTA